MISLNPLLSLRGCAGVNMGLSDKGVSGGVTQCRQLRPSSRREHVSASNIRLDTC